MRDMNNNFSGRTRKKPKREETDGKEEDCKEIGIPNHVTCLLNLYASQVATVRTGRGTTDWLKVREGVRQGCILLPAY